MTEQATVLIIEDEMPIRHFLRAGFAGGYRVVEAGTGREGLQLATMHNPDIVVLDLGLPDIDGVQVVQELRQWSDVPVIILTARDLEGEKVQALDSGANDYITKPFGMSELLARIRVWLRSKQQRPGNDEPIYENGDLRIDFAAREVRKKGEVVHLTATEYKLFAVLVRNAGKVVTHRQLLQEVWGAAYLRETQYVRVYMGQLRHKLEVNPARPEYLVTESNVGYRFRNQETASEGQS